MIRSHVCQGPFAVPLRLKFFIAVLLMVCFGCAPARYSSRTDNYLQAKDLFQRGQYEESAKYYQIYLEEYPDSRLQEVIMFRLGQCYRQMNNMEEARAEFQALIERYQTGFWVERAQKELSELP